MWLAPGAPGAVSQPVSLSLCPCPWAQLPCVLASFSDSPPGSRLPENLRLENAAVHQSFPVEVQNRDPLAGMGHMPTPTRHLGQRADMLIVRPGPQPWTHAH